MGSPYTFHSASVEQLFLGFLRKGGSPLEYLSRGVSGVRLIVPFWFFQGSLCVCAGDCKGQLKGIAQLKSREASTSRTGPKSLALLAGLSVV